VIGALELAVAVTWTGDVKLELFVGDVTTMPHRRNTVVDVEVIAPLLSVAVAVIT
jgi:hypothetical protein